MCHTITHTHTHTHVSVRTHTHTRAHTRFFSPAILLMELRKPACMECYTKGWVFWSSLVSLVCYFFIHYPADCLEVAVYKIGTIFQLHYLNTIDG